MSTPDVRPCTDKGTKKIQSNNSVSVRKNGNERAGEKKDMPLSKFRYLQILLKDLTLTTVFILTCFLLGINAIQQNRITRGCLLILIQWFPAFLLIPHELYHKSVLIPSQNKGSKIISIAFGFIFFPILPIPMYLHLLYNPKDVDYLSRLDCLHNYKIFMHSSLHCILLLYMAARGQLVEEESACISDQLGRSACITLPVLVNTTSTIVVVIISAISQQSLESRKETLLMKVMLSLPYIFSLLLLRLGAYAFIIVYLDVWAVIPISSIVFINMILHGYTATHIRSDEDEKADIDETDGLYNYALIWDGREWSSKITHLSLEENPKKKDRNQFISPLLQSLQSSIMYLPSGELYWRISCCFICNGMLLAVLVSIYILVNHVTTFHYEPNNINNSIFCSLIITFVLYSLISPFCLILHKLLYFNSTCKLILLIGVLIIIALTPLASLTFVNQNVTKRHLHFFTIQESRQGASVQTVDHVIIENIYFQVKYKYSEIYWDLSCATAIRHEHKLFFLNDENPDCDELLKKNVTYLRVTSDINSRSSSNSYNHLKLAKFLELQSDVKRSEALFTSRKEPTEKDIGHYLSCSNSTDIHIVNDSIDFNADKLIGKTLMKNNFIQEIFSVNLNGVKYHTTVYCKMVPHNTKLISDEKTLVANTLNSPNSVMNCCLNTTHSLKSFGQCKSRQNFLKMIQRESYIKEGDCSEKLIQNFFKFVLLKGPCVLKISFSTNCNDVLNLIPDCFFESCNLYFKAKDNV